MKRTLVLTVGSAEKRYDLPGAPSPADLADPERRTEAETRLAAFAGPAIALYSSAHHRLIIRGLQAVWERWGPQTMDLYILSCGYGLLAANDQVIPYEARAAETDDAELADRAARLHIPERGAALVRNYDLVFYLLSGWSLAALDLPLEISGFVQQIVLTDVEGCSRVPSAPNLHPFIADGGIAAQRWHVTADRVRGFLFERLCTQIVHYGPGVLDWLYRRPRDVELLFYKQTRWRPQLPLWPNRRR
jgi:hypothetical protein